MQMCLIAFNAPMVSNISSSVLFTSHSYHIELFHLLLKMLPYYQNISGLKNQLNGLYQYSESLNRAVYIDASNVLIFENGGLSCRYFGNSSFKIVNFIVHYFT